MCVLSEKWFIIAMVGFQAGTRSKKSEKGGTVYYVILTCCRWATSCVWKRHEFDLQVALRNGGKKESQHVMFLYSETLLRRLRRESPTPALHFGECILN